MRRAIDLEPHAIKTAELYAPGRTGADAVTWLLDDYPRLVAELRQLRRQLAGFNDEQSAFDQRLEALHRACSAILDL